MVECVCLLLVVCVRVELLCCVGDMMEGSSWREAVGGVAAAGCSGA